jgi:hypothetical protein
LIVDGDEVIFEFAAVIFEFAAVIFEFAAVMDANAGVVSGVAAGKVAKHGLIVDGGEAVLGIAAFISKDSGVISGGDGGARTS